MTTFPPPTLTPGEIEVFRSPSKIPTAEWAQKHFRLVAGPSAGRPFGLSKVPYARGIMDEWDKPWVRKIFFAAPSQVTKTTIAYACLASALWRSPGNAGVLMPGEQTAKRIFRDRITPHFQRSPALRRLVSRERHARLGAELRLRSGASIHAMWAGSESSISSISLKYLLKDEVDAYEDPAASGKSEERLIAYQWDSKCFEFSKVRGSLEESTMWRDMMGQSQALYKYRARCPSCGNLQVMEFESIRVPEGERDPAVIMGKRLAWYECECGARWDDYVRNQAVSAGGWHTDSLVDRPEVVGFHLPSWYSPFVSLSRVMADWFAAQGDPVKLREWDNAHPCKPYKVQAVELGEERIRRMVQADLEPMTVPGEALALTCGIDVQMQGFWFVVRAWAREGQSWLVHYGWLSHWDGVRELIASTYPVAGRDDVSMPIWRTAVDIGGGGIVEGWSKTDEIKYHLKGFAGLPVWGVKGASRSTQETVRPSIIGTDPNLSRRYQSEFLTIYILDTSKLKERILGAGLVPGGPYPMHLHNKTGEDYFKQLTAERQVRDRRSGKLVWDAGSRANHLLDCEVYAAACVDPDWSPSLHSLGSPPYVPTTRPVAVESRPVSALGGRVVNPYFNRR